MDNMVEDNKIIAEGTIDITPKAVLKSGRFESSTGAPEAAKPGWFKMVMYWKQEEIPGVSTRTKVTADLYLYHKYDWYSWVHGLNNQNDKTHITINGNKALLEKSVDVGGAVGGEYYVFSHSVEVSGTTSSIEISGRCDIGNSYDTPIWYGVEGSATVDLQLSLTAPSAPTTANLTGRFENGTYTTLSWSGATGTISGYDVERRFWFIDNTGSSYANWRSVSSDLNATSCNINHSAIDHHAQQCRVRSRNAAGTSAWKESNWVYHYGTTVYTTNGGSPVDAIVRVWNGSKWLNETYLLVWNGTKWVVGK